MSNPFIPITPAVLDWRNDLPFSIQFDDVYFSITGGIQQSRYVFIDGNDLVNRWSSLSAESHKTFTIAETGFGTGLNFALSLHLWRQHAPSNAHLHYISCEKHPLSLADLQKSLALWPELAYEASQLYEQYPILTPGFHQLYFANENVTLTLMLGDALDCFEQLLFCGEAQLESQLRTQHVDAWYLDGFAPSKNERMWSEPLMSAIAMLSTKNTTLASYTSAGFVVSALQHVGFIIEKRKGFGPKRHMIQGHFSKVLPIRSKRLNTPWHVTKVNTDSNKNALIIGAGLAGCFTAYSLARRGWTVTVIDALEKPGSWGSANQNAVLFPKLSAYRSPLTQFMLTSFLYAVQVYRGFLKKHQIGALEGALLLAYNPKEAKAIQSLEHWLAQYPQLGVLVDTIQGTQLAGLELDKSGLFIPLSGWIDSPALCQVLLEDKNITVTTGQTATALLHDGINWIVNDNSAPVLILANGGAVSCFKDTNHLPVKVLRGQMTSIKTTDESMKLKIPLCAAGHVLPQRNGTHTFGASYDPGNSLPVIHPHDDEENFTKLTQITSIDCWSRQLTGHWAGIRAATPDYLPLVGPVAKENEFLRHFQGLETNSKRWIAQAGPYHPGLYVCAGFGSRGLTTIPLSAEWLASTLNNEVSCLPRYLTEALSPARFLRKKIIRGS